MAISRALARYCRPGGAAAKPPSPVPRPEGEGLGVSGGKNLRREKRLRQQHGRVGRVCESHQQSAYVAGNCSATLLNVVEVRVPSI